MRTLFVLLFTLILGTNTASAQKLSKERLVSIWGHIRDSFTKNGISGVMVTIMNADSTMIDTMRVWGGSMQGVTYDTYYRFRIPAVPQKLIIKAEHPDYEDTYVDFDMKFIKRNTYFDVPWHYMKRKSKKRQEYNMEGELSEVVVTATKVRIAYRGDTLVYNADAFNVPNGSMLDGLLKQMDGVELDNKTGEIKVNGRKVDYLTLNGKDFFKGNNKVMLQNLPYYTVKEIKVFDKQTDNSMLAGRDIEKKDYVMDVQLKREYSLGYIGNAEAAGGLAIDNENGKVEADRYMGRLFGMTMGEKFRIVLMGNVNNVNRSGGVDSSGDWDERITNDGEYKYKHAGLSVYYSGKDNTINNELSAMATWGDRNLTAQTSEENFLASGSTFGKSNSRQEADTRSINISDVFKIRMPQAKLPINLTTTINLNHKRQDNYEAGDYYTFASNPFGEGVTAADSINSRQGRSVFKGNYTDLSINNQLNIKLPWGDMFAVKLNGGISDGDNDKYSINRYRYHQQEGKNETQNRYYANPVNSFSYYASASYIINWLSGWSLDMSGISKYNYYNRTMDYYKLEQLGDRYGDIGIDDWHIMLPSTMDSLLMCRDTYNSNRYIKTNRTHSAYLSPKYTKEGKGEYTWFSVELKLNQSRQTLRYHSSQLETKEKKDFTHLYTNVFFYRSFDDRNKTIHTNLNISKDEPDLLNMIDVVDSSNPLSIYMGNQDLKMSTSYNWSSSYSVRKPKKKDFQGHVNIGANMKGNAIRQGYTYDSKTGVRTYRPMNINGIWSTGFDLGFGSAIDSAKYWRYYVNLDYTLSHDADFAGVDNDNNSSKSTILSHSASLYLRLQYQRNKLSLSAEGSFRYSNSHRKKTASLTASALDDINLYFYRLGLNGSYELPWQLQVATKIDMEFNRGYESDYLDKSRVMWNLSLSRPLMKGKFMLRVIANDILGQYSNHSINLSSSGYSERWTNGLGRYVMASLQWKFNKTKKK